MYEYEKMAKYYDLFYKNKSYEHEIKFLTHFMTDKRTVLDVGCGTGIHMHLLEEKGYKVDGLDLSKNMLEIANTRTNGKLFQGNLLDYKVSEKYDVIISMFAVFNHLKNYEELEKGILHWYHFLNKDGVLIIDLHNGRTSGEKKSLFQVYERIMRWTFDEENFKEYTEIDYIIDGKTYHDTHEFMIYEMNNIKQILDKNHLKYKIYENYSLRIASDNSKNIEIVITK